MRWEAFMILGWAVLFGGCEDFTSPDDGRPPEPQRFEWSGKVGPAARIEIRNINGDVRARPSSDGMVRVQALKQGKNDDPSSVRIEVLETLQGVTICASIPMFRVCRRTSVCLAWTVNSHHAATTSQ